MAELTTVKRELDLALAELRTVRCPEQIDQRKVDIIVRRLGLVKELIDEATRPA